MTCHHCGADTTNGLALCALCQRKAAADLEFLPVYFRNLARWRRPARPNGSLGGSSSWLMRKGDTDDANRIGRVLDEAANDLGTWARMLADDRCIEHPASGDTDAETVAALCAWLAEHLTSIATLEWCGEFMRDSHDAERKQQDKAQGIGYHERQLRGLTETAVPGWYAGACKTCTSPTYVVPGLTWVTCQVCGTTTYARDHLDTILEEAQGWVARPKAIAETLVAMLDTEQSVSRLYDRIRKWESLGLLLGTRRTDADGDEVGPKRYRLGEVLNLLLSHGATRLEAKVKTRAS